VKLVAIFKAGEEEEEEEEGETPLKTQQDYLLY